jgi:hypothetical protein
MKKISKKEVCSDSEEEYEDDATPGPGAYEIAKP